MWQKKENNIMLIDPESLFFTENNLKDQLKECEYWGELKLSNSQYRQLCEMVSVKYKEIPETKRIEKLYKAYPVSMITTMIFYIVFDYQDEFWMNWAERVNISLNLNRESAIGKFVRNFFDQNGFTYELDGYRNITPLLCQAGIPDSNLENLFHIISTTEGFDAEELLHEMQGWRKYQIRKPVERFIRLHEKKMTSLLLTVNDVMRNNENLDVEDLYEKRIADKFGTWKEKNLNKNGKYRGKYALQESPHLIYDSTYGLTIILPAYFLENEYCREIMWRISSDEEEIYSLRCNVINEGMRLQTAEKKIPVNFHKSYTVSLLDPENVEGELKLNEDWKIKGWGEDDYMLFDHKGKRRTDQTYPMEGGVLLLKNGFFAEFESTFYNELAVPVNAGGTVTEFIPQGNLSRIRIEGSENISFYVKKNVKTVFRGGSQLFGDAVSLDETPIFTELPDLGISREGISCLSILIRNRDTGYKENFILEDDDLTAATDETWNYYDLKAFLPKENGKFGRYAVRIYDRGEFKKELEFIWVPLIEYDNSEITFLPRQRGGTAPVFRYKKKQGVQIEFTSPVKISNEAKNSIYWKRIESAYNNAFLEGILLLESEDIRICFKKRVRVLQWAFWNQEEPDLNYDYDIKRISREDFQTKNWQITMRIAPEQFEKQQLMLRLYSASAELIQEVAVKPNRKGIWNLSSAIFAVTLENRRLPIHLYLAQEHTSAEYCMMEIYEPVMIEGMKIEKDGTVQKLIWENSNVDDIENHLMIQSLTDYDAEDRKFENIQKVEDNYGKPYYFMVLDPPLVNGIYKVTRAEENEFFFDFEGNDIAALPDGNTFMVNPGEEVGKINSGNISAYIKGTTISYRSPKPLAKIKERLLENISCIKGEPTENDLKQLLALTLYAVQNKEGSCEELIYSILQILYKNQVAETDRIKLFHLLKDAELSEAEKRKVIQFYHLQYLRGSCFAYSKEEIRNLIRQDTFMGIRSLMLQPKESWQAETLINHIGIEALQMLLTFEKGDLGWIGFFESWLGGKDVPCKVGISEVLIGKTELFYQMFDWKNYNYSIPKLDISQKPENEIIFWGDGYINLLIKWYYHGLGKHPEELESAKKLAPVIEDMATKVTVNADSAVKTYSRRIRCREIESKSGFYPLLKSSASCGLIFSLWERERICLSKEDEKQLMEFIFLMEKVFPELLKRDIILAQLYLFMTEV